MTDRAETVIRYHERTKHHPHRYAKSPAFLDWTNEPNPFTRYKGTALVHLPFIERDPEANHYHLYSRGAGQAQPFSLRNIASFLELSMGLSAWKSLGGSSWALRMNPSSGNLHPTETHLVLPPMPENGGQGGVFHYTPLLHTLEQRAVIGPGLWAELREHFGSDGFFTGLSSIYWRESWKYGERAFRYCNQDVGHAVACLSFVGSLLGWRTTALNALSDEELGIVLGFDKVNWIRFERENPELLLFVHSASDEEAPLDIPSGIIDSFSALPFGGKPGPLSEAHIDWHIIDEVSAAAEKPKTAAKRCDYGNLPFIEKEISSKTAAAVIRRRRSALAFDRKASLPSNAFFAMLDKTLPRSNGAPFDTGIGEASVHLLLFVHQVPGLQRGLYFLVRNEKNFVHLRQSCNSPFAWERVAGARGTLPLYLLRTGDFREQAEGVSCNQEIAGDGVFSLAMIAEFREKIRERPFSYRHLHWEAGMVGQVLYLEAEAHGMRGTGMGCFFDDPVHEILGLRDNTYQDIYHFAVGKAVEDKRLTTLPPYHHLKGQR